MNERLVERLNINIQEFQEIEENIAILKLAIYQDKVRELKEKKEQELKDLIFAQATFYNQNYNDYKKQIDEILNKNDEEFSRLEEAYNEFFIIVFKIMENAILNQNIAIHNILKLKRKYDLPGKEEQEYKKIEKIIRAMIQKKLNYSVIVDECQERLKWAIRNYQNDVLKTFNYQGNLGLIVRQSFIEKIKNKIINRFSGKKKFKIYLKELKSARMNKVKSKNKKRIIKLCAVLKGFQKQIRTLRDDISVEFIKNS